jgi:hypothetical protein
MARGIKEVRHKNVGLVTASRMFSFPRTTLNTYVSNRGKEAEALVTAKMGRKPVLSVETETELVKYCLFIEINTFRSNRKIHKRTAFQLATRNNLPQ